MRTPLPPVATVGFKIPTLGVLAGLLAACATAPTRKAQTPAAPNRLTFIDDQYDRARAEATARKVPLFVEAWAPW